MKKLLTLVNLCVFLTLNAQHSFKAITYNLRWNNLEDDEDQWDHRKDAIAGFLVEEAADFMGFQEALTDQVYFLERYLAFYKYIGVGRDDGQHKGEFCPIFYDAEKWSLVETSTIWLSATPQIVSMGWDAACNRIVTYGLFTKLQSNDTVAVFNTHLDHVGETARRNSIKLIKEYVKEKSDRYPHVILGDFNFTPDANLYEMMTNHFDDARLAANHVYAEHEGTFNGFRLKGIFDKRIDYVFTSRNLTVLSYDCPELRIDGRHMSDHFPIIVQIRKPATD